MLTTINYIVNNVNLKYIFLILILVLVIPNVFSQVNLTLKTPSDLKENTFYISKNITKSIDFQITSDYISSSLNKYRAEYDLKVYSSSLKQINFSLSKKEEYFVSYVNSTLSLNIRSLDFTDEKIKLRIKVLIYDFYNNLIDYDYLFIDIISNNSEYEFSDSLKNEVPEYKGYSLSRDKMFILNRLDNDKITIQNHVKDIFYGTECSSNTDDIVLDLRYQGNNFYSLEVSIKPDKNVSKDVFQINCFSYYKGDLHYIKPITVNYLDQKEVTDSLEEIEEEKENFFKSILNRFKEKIKKD
jgi:hypothetical protein